MSYSSTVYNNLWEYTSKDLAQLELIGVRRNSYTVSICSLIALASIFIYGFQWSVFFPIIGITLASFFNGLLVNERFLALSQRLLVVLVFVVVTYLVLVSNSISTVVLFVPLATYVFFTERIATVRWLYASAVTVVLSYAFVSFWPDVGLSGVSATLLNFEAIADCILATLFTGIFLRSHSIFSRIIIEVAKAHAARLEESVAQTKSTIRQLEGQRSDLSSIREKTSEALASERNAASEIRASQEQLDQFAYAASHDLKEPIRTVRSFYQVIRRRIDPEVLAKAEVAGLFDLVEGRSASMHNMLERLLLFSRVSRTQGQKRKIDLRDVVVSSLALLKDKPALIFDIQKNAGFVYMDSKCVRKIFQELVSNAVSFASEKRPLTLTFSAQLDPDGYVHCVMTDNGIGIPKASLGKVIGLFQRLGAGNQDGKSGLGLSIAKAITEHEGGSLWLTSDGETGTSVHFRLPVYAEEKELVENRVEDVQPLAR